MKTLLSHRIKEIDDLIDDCREGNFERNIEELRDPRNNEECDEANEKTDDGIANGVHCFLDLLLITSRQNEGDTSYDDVHKTQDRCNDETKSDDRKNDVEWATVFDEIANHKSERGEVRKV